jgi:hypothetical protein
VHQEGITEEEAVTEDAVGEVVEGEGVEGGVREAHSRWGWFDTSGRKRSSLQRLQYQGTVF